MKLRKSLLKKSQLYPVRSPAARVATSNGIYLILDSPGFNSLPLKKIYRLVSGKEIGLIQLGDKVSAKADILKFAIKLARHLALTKMLFIVNDYVDVAVACGADGVHLGQKDLSLNQARKILGKNKIIGLSCHNLAQALKAQKEGADYIGIGPVYATVTKPEYKPIGLEVLRELKDKIKIPYFAIGDIHTGNLKEITAAGARRVAVCRAILEANDPKQAAKRLYKKLRKI